jgi:hypothetical protein
MAEKSNLWRALSYIGSISANGGWLPCSGVIVQFDTLNRIFRAIGLILAAESTPMSGKGSDTEYYRDRKDLTERRFGRSEPEIDEIAPGSLNQRRGNSLLAQDGLLRGF